MALDETHTASYLATMPGTFSLCTKVTDQKSPMNEPEFQMDACVTSCRTGRKNKANYRPSHDIVNVVPVQQYDGAPCLKWFQTAHFSQSLLANSQCLELELQTLPTPV